MKQRQHRFKAMGCPCELRFYTETGEEFSNAVGRCVTEIDRLERKYSRYRPDSLTTAINGAAGRGPTAIDPETASILRYAEVCHEQSGGAFDITSGVFRLVWHSNRASLPSQREIDTCLAVVGWNKISYSNRQVRLPLPGMELDFGGIVKEYAADSVAVLASKVGVRSGLVNLGGDIRIVAPRPDGRAWSIGIAHPRCAGSPIATVSLKEGALATSGGYERFVEIGGKRYSHFIDPRTGWPVEGLLSISVVADQAVVAGSIASIASLQQQSEGLKWLERCDTPYLAIDSRLSCHGHLFAGEKLAPRHGDSSAHERDHISRRR